MNKKSLYYVLIGNVFEHYDLGLYFLLIPYIAPLFYGDLPHAYALALSFFPIDWIFRPLGIYLFHYMSKKFSLKMLLLFSLSGMGFTSLVIALLPTKAILGIASPILLMIFRGLMYLFSSGESVLAPLYVLRSTPSEKKVFISSLYEVSSILGVLLASIFVSLLASKGCILTYWRWLYLIGGGISLFGLGGRIQNTHNSFEDNPLESKIKLSFSWDVLKPIIIIAVVTALSCQTYDISMRLCNGYLPMITKRSLHSMINMHMFLSILDMLLLPCLGKFATKFGSTRTMKLSALALAIGAVPLFYIAVNTNSWFAIFALRSYLVLFGVGFAAPYQYYIQQQANQKLLYTQVAVGKALGKFVISSPMISISFMLLATTGWGYFPVLSLSFLAIAAYGILHIRGAEDQELAVV